MPPGADTTSPALGPSEEVLRNYSATGLIRVRLKDAAMAVQQNSPQVRTHLPVSQDAQCNTSDACEGIRTRLASRSGCGPRSGLRVKIRVRIHAATQMFRTSDFYGCNC